MINKVMSKYKAPKIPPLLVNNLFVLNCKEKEKLFTQIFQSNVHLLTFSPYPQNTAVYPEMWKRANVIPIYKTGDKQFITNYRPISLLPICGKIHEKIIFTNLYNRLITHRLNGCSA